MFANRQIIIKHQATSEKSLVIADSNFNLPAYVWVNILTLFPSSPISKGHIGIGTFKDTFMLLYSAYQASCFSYSV